MSTEVNRALWDERAPAHAASPALPVSREAPERLPHTHTLQALKRF